MACLSMPCYEGRMRFDAARVDSSPSMARESSTAVQVTFRIPKELIPLADEVAALLSRPGLRASRNDALRAGVARGLEVLREEAIAAAAPSPAAPRAKKR